MENMEIYEAARQVPKEAQKPITGGRLNGFTDINPMWRIKRLTEIFGPCGVGWWYEITDKRLESGTDGQVAAFVDVVLHYKTANGEPSHGIPGTGGSMFIAKERSGLHTSDEAYKMALTDALSVAAKAVGVAADIYFAKDRTKYNSAPQEEAPQKPAKGAQTPEQAVKGVTQAMTQKPPQKRPVDIQTQRDAVLSAFGSLNHPQSQKQLETVVGLPVEKWESKEISLLRQVYKDMAAQD